MKKFCLLLVIFCLSAAYAEVSAQQAKQLVILEKPAPELPDKDVTLDVSGTVKLKVEFLSDGKIGNIEPVSSPHPLLTQRAIEAAKRIKFSPEMQDGVAVTVDKMVEYEYSWNGGWKRQQSAARPANKLAEQAEKAEAILQRAVEKLGGEKYLRIKTIYGKGAYSQFKDGAAIGYSSFIDIIVFPDHERTEFKQGGYKTIQTNYGDSGWIYGEDTRSVNNQTKAQIDDFKRTLKVSLDYLLRGAWRAEGGKLSYLGRREASLGRRNEAKKLSYSEDFWVEFEFAAADGLPAKAVYE